MPVSMKTNVSSKKKALLAGITMLLLVAASVSYAMPAMAQENGEEQQNERPQRQRAKTLAIGIGAAVDPDEDKMYRSHFKLGLQKASEESETDFVVKRGIFVINDEGSPVRYPAIPETWEVEVREDHSAFNAEGNVEDSDGNVFSVELKGELLRETEHGALFVVKGEFSGDGEEYELYYISAVIKRPAVSPAASAVEDTAGL